MMLKCWQENPLERPTFTEIREEFEEIMTHGETYVTFDIDESSNYYLAPSFKSVPSENEEDDTNADETKFEPTIVTAIVHSQQS